MIKRVHVPEMTLQAADIALIGAAVEEELGRWINSATEEEVVVFTDMARAITSAVLGGFVEVGKKHKAA